jgi:hypothetical protein
MACSAIETNEKSNKESRHPSLLLGLWVPVAVLEVAGAFACLQQPAWRAALEGPPPKSKQIQESCPPKRVLQPPLFCFWAAAQEVAGAMACLHQHGVLHGDLTLPSSVSNAAAQEVAGAMACLHQHGVLHGDLTCQNILLTSSTKDSRRWIAQVGATCCGVPAVPCQS